MITQCDKCKDYFPSEEITACYHFDLETHLGNLCDFCLNMWFAYEQGIEDGQNE